MKLSDKLIELRKTKGWSQEDFAEMLDVSRQAISRWENGTALPDAQNILRISKLFNVSAGNFLPAPKVDSAVVRFDLYKESPVKVDSEEIFFKVIRAAFGQRRKTLLNALGTGFAHIPKDSLARIICDCGFAPTVRGEKLGIAEFALIANGIFGYQQGEKVGYTLL